MSAVAAADHGQRMDAIYSGQRHVYDATRKFYLLGRDRLIGALDPPAGGQVIEIGCGTGRNLIAAARRWPDARFHGIDISDAMLATARGAIDRAGLSSRIALAHGDASTFAPAALGLAAAERIFFSYTLSMIPDWTGAIARAAEALAPGGRIDIVDFGQQEHLPAAWRRLLFAWLARFDVRPRPDLEATVRATAAEHRLAADFQALLGGYAWAASLGQD